VPVGGVGRLHPRLFQFRHIRFRLNPELDNCTGPDKLNLLPEKQCGAQFADSRDAVELVRRQQEGRRRVRRSLKDIIPLRPMQYLVQFDDLASIPKKSAGILIVRVSDG